MKKIGIKTIEVSSLKKEEFDVYPCHCKIGDTVWFDGGIPDENGVITNHNYIQGKVTEIDHDHWWIYDDGEKELGQITVKVEDDEFYTGQNFAVAFKNIIYEDPCELQRVQELLESCRRLHAEMNQDIEFLMNEYKTNKKYFRQEPGRCTINDVIKTVFEFAWQKSKIYYENTNS